MNCSLSFKRERSGCSSTEPYKVYKRVYIHACEMCVGKPTGHPHTSDCSDGSAAQQMCVLEQVMLWPWETLSVRSRPIKPWWCWSPVKTACSQKYWWVLTHIYATCDRLNKWIIELHSSRAGQVQEGSRSVRLGTLIALLVGEGEDWKQVEIPALQPVTPAAAPPTAAPPTAADPAPLAPVTAALKQSVSACVVWVIYTENTAVTFTWTRRDSSDSEGSRLQFMGRL